MLSIIAGSTAAQKQIRWIDLEQFELAQAFAGVRRFNRRRRSKPPQPQNSLGRQTLPKGRAAAEEQHSTKTQPSKQPEFSKNGGTCSSFCSGAPRPPPTTCAIPQHRGGSKRGLFQEHAPGKKSTPRTRSRKNHMSTPKNAPSEKNVVHRLGEPGKISGAGGQYNGEWRGGIQHGEWRGGVQHGPDDRRPPPSTAAAIVAKAPPSTAGVASSSRSVTQLPSASLQRRVRFRLRAVRHRESLPGWRSWSPRFPRPPPAPPPTKERLRDVYAPRWRRRW